MKNDQDQSAARAPSGSVYRLVVRSADEAVQTIRERFGSAAKVLSVRQQEQKGLSGFFLSPKLEVLVQIAEPDQATGAGFVGVAGGKTEVPAATTVNIPQPAAAAASEAKGAAHTAEQPEKPDPEPAADKPAAEEPRISSRRTDFASAPSLPDLLRRAGFSETFLAQAGTLPSWARHAERPLHVTLVDLGRDLRRLADRQKPRPLPARTAFIGSRGVGRTTALCKWLGSEIFSRGRYGRVIKVEFDQPNSTENLAVYCEALGLNLEHYYEGLDIAVGQNQFLYADVPGFCFHRPNTNRELARFLDAAGFEGRVLVLNALHDHTTLRAAYSAGRDLGATHLVFTHCDELIHWGKLMDFLIDGDLTPLFLATGPSLSGDCDEDVIGTTLRRTIPGA